MEKKLLFGLYLLLYATSTSLAQKNEQWTMLQDEDLSREYLEKFLWLEKNVRDSIQKFHIRKFSETSWQYEEGKKVNYIQNYTFNTFGNFTTYHQTKNGEITFSDSMFYDDSGRLKECRSSNRKEDLFYYNEKGQLVKHLEKRSGHTIDSVTFVYDERGRLLMEKGSCIYEREYDERGNCVSIKVKNKKISNVSGGHPVIIDEKYISYTTIFQYDNYNNIVSRSSVDKNGLIREEKFGYDSLGRLVKETHHHEKDTGRSIEYEYDLKGNLVREKAYYNNVCAGYINYTYDTLGRLVKTEEYVFYDDQPEDLGLRTAVYYSKSGGVKKIIVQPFQWGYQFPPEITTIKRRINGTTKKLTSVIYSEHEESAKDYQWWKMESTYNRKGFLKMRSVFETEKKISESKFSYGF